MEKLRARALLIDLDGTIADSMEIFETAADAAFRAVGQNASSHRVGRRIARCLQLNRSLAPIFEEYGVENQSRDTFLDVFLQSFYNLATRRTRLFPNVESALRELASSFPLALITRRHVPRERVVEELNRLGIGSLFKTVVTSLDVAKPTPSPDALLKAAEELGVPIDSCAVISDSGVDIQAGRRAGAKTVAVLSGLFSEKELNKESPDLIIESVRRLPNHVVPTG